MQRQTEHFNLSVLDPEATVEFQYWRVLVSSAAFMTETIDAWDGEAWVNLYTALFDVQQPDWTPITIDLSAYNNADFQLRFGHEYDAQLPVASSGPSGAVPG